MSSEPNSKRRKMHHQKSQSYFKSLNKCLEPGLKGFMATCNFREKDCVRECYNLLNEYADETTSIDEMAAPNAPNNELLDASIDEKSQEKPVEHKTDGDDNGDDDDEEDIATQLEKEIKKVNSEQKTNQNRFRQVETKTPNCIFIKSTVDDPNRLGVKIVRDIAKTKKQKTRFLLRFLPVDMVCKATVDDIKNAAGKLFDKYFLNIEPTTFSIVVNKRYNNNVDRMKIIHELANIVSFKNVLHKVDLKNPKVSVVVEIIKGLCCLTILPDYNDLKKYNLFELANAKENVETAVTDENADGNNVKEEKDSHGKVEPKHIETKSVEEEIAKNVDAKSELDAETINTE